MKNIFVIGLDEFNGEELESVRVAEKLRFVGLLDYDEIVFPRSGSIEFERLRRKAEEQLRATGGGIDGIATYWDFPSSGMAGVLRNAYGLPGPSNEAVARCEHKYWSRVEQAEVVPDMVPGFCAINPFANDPFEYIDIDYPFWIKPVKAHSSHLGFRIANAAELRAHLPEIRERIGYFADPFNEYLHHVDMPDRIRHVTGHWCIAERMISAGQQCTLEGYVYESEATVYGVVDSIRAGKNRSSFSRYQYPSLLPRHVQERMIDAAGKIMHRFAYNCAPFNMEFYWNRRTDRIHLLEVNARISKSHCPLFRMVDGASHQKVMIDLALGRRPVFPYRQGPFAIAGKFMHRVFDDGIVRAMPSPGEISRAREAFPELRLRLLAAEGDCLGNSHHRDSYSFELADIFLGGRNQRQLLQKFRDSLEIMTFDIQPLHYDAA